MEIKEIQKVMKEVEVVIKRYNLCDKCDKKIEDELYDAFSFEIEYKQGNTYPEGGNYIDETIELCKSCAKELMNNLSKQGYRTTKREGNY